MWVLFKVSHNIQSKVLAILATQVGNIGWDIFCYRGCSHLGCNAHTCFYFYFTLVSNFCWQKAHCYFVHVCSQSFENKCSQEKQTFLNTKTNIAIRVGEPVLLKTLIKILVVLLSDKFIMQYCKTCLEFQLENVLCRWWA